MSRSLSALAVVAAFSLYSEATLADLPETGAYWSGFSYLDYVIRTWANGNDVNAVTVAVVRDKKLVYERGFGYQDAGMTQDILPDARMRLATNSVMLTQLALRKLVNDGDLSMTDLVVDALDSDVGTPINGIWGSPISMNAITIQDLLDETACFEEGYQNTYVGQNYYGSNNGLGRNATAAERIKWHWGQSTTMRPGCTVGNIADKGFSHYAMEVAGQIIAQKAYELWGDGWFNPGLIDVVEGYNNLTEYWFEFYISDLGGPLAAEFLQARNLPGQAYPREIWYDSAGDYGTWPDLGTEWDQEWTHVCPGYPDCWQVPAAYSIDFTARPGSGTIVASARDVARLASIYWPADAMSPKPTVLGDFNKPTHRGWGGLAGTTTFVWDRVLDNSSGKHPITAVVLANKSKDVDTSYLAEYLPLALQLVSNWPTYDLFEDTRIKNYWNSKYMQLSGGSITYGSLSTSSRAQRWRMWKDIDGYTRIVNAANPNGMISNEHNYANAEYLIPNSTWWSQQWALELATRTGARRIAATRWYYPNRLNVENQTGYVEQSSVPNYYQSAWWLLQPVPSGATTCSNDPAAPTCLCRSYAVSTTPCTCGTSNCPPYWDTLTCGPLAIGYNNDDGCDCECGGWDPDCDDPLQPVYCRAGGSGTACDKSTLQCI